VAADDAHLKKEENIVKRNCGFWLILLELCPLFLSLFSLFQTQYLTHLLPYSTFSRFLDTLGVSAGMLSLSSFFPLGLVGILSHKKIEKYRLVTGIFSILNLCIGTLVAIGFTYFFIMLFSGNLHV